MQIELERLVGAIGHSLSGAQLAIAASGTENYLSHFHQSPGGRNGAPAYAPDTVSILIPPPDSTCPPAQVDLPLVTLSNHNTVGLDSVRIRLHAAAEVNESGQVVLDLTPPSDGSAPPTLTEMELSFRCGDPPEGAARVNVEMNKFL